MSNLRECEHPGCAAPCPAESQCACCTGYFCAEHLVDFFFARWCVGCIADYETTGAEMLAEELAGEQSPVDDPFLTPQARAERICILATAGVAPDSVSAYLNHLEGECLISN